MVRAALKNKLNFVLIAIVALGLASGPMSGTAHAQSDVVESARALCSQATGIWETQDQWAIRQLSTLYNEVSTQVSASEFDESIRGIYRNWASAFAVEQPCDKDILTIVASSTITRQSWDTFNRCLQGGIDARRSAVETFAREHQSLVQEVAVGSVNMTTADASRDYLIALAQAAGLRSCRP
jgi:hypothetical protein